MKYYKLKDTKTNKFFNGGLITCHKERFETCYNSYFNKNGIIYIKLGCLISNINSSIENWNRNETSKFNKFLNIKEFFNRFKIIEYKLKEVQEINGGQFLCLKKSEKSYRKKFKSNLKI